MVTVFLDVPFIMFWRILVDRRCASKDDYIAAVISCLEVHRDFWVPGNVPYLMCGRLTVHEERISVPVKPDRVRLRGLTQRYRGQPDSIFLFEAFLGTLS